MTVLVRERAPLRLHASVVAPDGYTRRWALDEPKPDYALGSLTFSSTMPGGHEQASSSLARKIAAEFPDLVELATVTIMGAGGEVAWQGRLEGSPRTWGSQSSVQPQLMGWQSHLEDDNTAREIYVDVDRTKWAAGSVQRKINLINALVDSDDPSSAADVATGFPSVLTGLAGPWTRDHVCEAFYDASGLVIAKLYYAWKNASPVVGGGPAIDPTNSNWLWAAGLWDTDVSGGDSTGTLRAAGPGSGLLAASTATRKWANLLLEFLVAGGVDGATYQIAWTAVGVYGNHGVPLQGAGDFVNAPGVLGSDVIAHAVGKWAPKLSFTTGPDGTIQPSTFVIPQLAFLDPTTAAAIIQGASAFDVQNFAVWDGPNGPTFFWAPWGVFGRKWRARVGEAQLQDAGPQMSRLWNGAVVTYTDVSGLSRSVGPPGSGCNVEDASLLDPDPSNPANEAGIRRWSPPLQIGVSTSDAAIKVGQAFLGEQKLLDTSGQAALVGHVMDDHGVLWPSWMIRAGDEISFVDSSSTGYRRIVRAEYEDATKTCSVSLDSPPDGLQQLLARLGVVTSPISV